MVFRIWGIFIDTWDGRRQVMKRSNENDEEVGY